MSYTQPMRTSSGLGLAVALAVLGAPSIAHAQYAPAPAPQGGTAPPSSSAPPQGYAPPSNAPPPGAYPPANGYPPPNANGGYAAAPAYYNEPPPPPPRRPDNGFKIPEFSVRIDPLNWILAGRLGVQLESQVWKFISVELVPVFVVNDSPPELNMHTLSSALTQHSNGLGPISGTSIGAGFWLNGKPFRGTVLRVIFTNYGYSYKTNDNSGNLIDQVDHTERQLYGYIGSAARWGFFTIAGGIGLGVELNNQQRCFPSGATIGQPTTSNCKGELDIALDKNLQNVANLNGPLHPAYLMARLSLGVVF